MNPPADGSGAAAPLVFVGHEIDELLKKRQELGKAYHPFLRVPTMHAGVYHLAAGAQDGQSPHDEDEMYYVVHGRGRFSVDGKGTRDVRPGSVLFVKAGAAHRFHDITEDLDILVFFSTAKS